MLTGVAAAARAQQARSGASPTLSHGPRKGWARSSSRFIHAQSHPRLVILITPAVYFSYSRIRESYLSVNLPKFGHRCIICLGLYLSPNCAYKRCVRTTLETVPGPQEIRISTDWFEMVTRGILVSEESPMVRIELQASITVLVLGTTHPGSDAH